MKRIGRLLHRPWPAVGIEHPRPVVVTGEVQRDPCRMLHEGATLQALKAIRVEPAAAIRKFA